ncbi:MAG: D-aminoacyl-tRNA deacylase [Bacillota bacterium]
MKLVIQRVEHAECSVEGETISSIKDGLLVYVGFKVGDSEALIGKMAKKTVNLRIFEDDAGKMNRSLKETGGSVLAVSQFTLEGDARKGNRPSFTKALNPEDATILFDRYLEALQKEGASVAAGKFQAHMKITSTNDGPVTILLERTHDDD